MDSVANDLFGRYFSSQRTAAMPKVISGYISLGLLMVARVMYSYLASEFVESIKFNAPTINGRMTVGFDGEIGWLPEPSEKGYVFVSLKLDQFDLRKAELYYKFTLPNGSQKEKSLDLGSWWLDQPIPKVGKQLAEVLKDRLDGFFLAVESSMRTRVIGILQQTFP